MTSHRNAVLVLVLCSACSGTTTQMLGSQYVKSGTFGPNGGTLTVLASDDAALAGTQIIIPPGALSAPTTIQIGVTNQAVVSSGALGPIVDFEQSGTVFAVPATVTIPATLNGVDPSRVGVMAVEPSGSSHDITAVTVAKGGASSLATFQVSGFTHYGCHDEGEDQDGGCTPQCGDDATCGSSDGCGGTCNQNCDGGTGGTTGGTSGGTTGGTTGGSGANCPTGASWIGDTCAVTACSPQYTGAGCLMADAGIGECLGTQCLDVSGDPLHCGSPETACADGMACDAGSCVGSSGCVGDGGCPAGDLCQADGRRCLPSACDADAGQRICNGGVCCGDICSQLDGGTDCGACGVTCGDAGFCYADSLTGASTCGDCSSVPTGTGCNGGICCGGTCVDQTSDGTNCGGCGRMCETGSCNNGFCSGGCAACPDGTSCKYEVGSVFDCVSNTCTPGHDGFPCGQFGACCGSACLADGFGGDPNNCGSCGNVCADGGLCASGVCIQSHGCPSQSSESVCLMDGGGQGTCCDDQCVDVTSDSANCNECGNECAVGTSCQSGSCPTPDCTQANCPDGSVCAEGECVAGCAGRNDGDYCGGVEDGGGPYLGFCCGGVCSSLGDPQSCGGCGLVCPTGASCFAGGCQLYPSFTPFVCGGVGAPACVDGYGCWVTNSQYGDACAPQDCTSRSNGDPCSYGPEASGECCNGSCVVVTQDPANCGGCGLSCPSGICSEDFVLEYVSDSSYPVLVGVGVCKPAATAATCTPDCATGFTCVNGSCVDGLCTGAACFQEDDAVGACCGNGACVDLLTDSANCGGCGLACPEAEACVSGQCQGDACSLENSGAYCEQNDATHACCGNACVDTSTDPANCGRCGVACPVGTTCSGGGCG